MAECRSCGKEIPEGTLYCNECETRMKADESYLDSLLSSVVANSVESAPERPVKKTTAEPVPSVLTWNEEAEEEQESFVIEALDESVVESEEASDVYELSDDVFDSFDGIADESYEVNSEELATELFESVPVESDVNLFGIMSEDTDDEAFASVVENTADPEPEVDFDDSIQENRYDIFTDTDDSFLDDLFESPETENLNSEEVSLTSEDALLEDLLRSVDGAEDEAFDLEAMRADAAAYDNTDLAEEQAVASVFDSYDETLDAEAALLGAALAEEVFAGEDVSDDETGFISDSDVTGGEEAVSEDDFFGMLTAQEPEELPMEEDPLAMLGFAGEQTESAEDFGTTASDDDVMDIWGLMNSDTATTEDNDGESAFGDFPELFGEDVGLMDIPEIASVDQEDSEEAPDKQNKKKKNIFKRIFGNVREDLTEEEIEERKREALEKFEEDEQKAADDAAREKLHKEQRAKLKEEEAAKKQAEKEALAKKKAEEKRAKAEEKRLLKDKKEQAKRALLAEIEANEGKINKFGASIIIIMFAAVLCLITIGTSYYNYKISIDKAQFDFDLQRYDDAYNDVYGLKIKEEDMELYDKIMTVQYVNVQLLSYMRYNSLDMDAEALDSLIKGLRRYEKFLQHGTELGVKDDLNYLKTQIIEQLDDVFGIDEATAYEMLALETQEEYSVQIYDIVSKKN